MVKYFYDISGLTQANWKTRFLVDIYVLKTMIYCLNWVSLRKSYKVPTENPLNAVITYAINAISEDDAMNWFYYCGLFAGSIR